MCMSFILTVLTYIALNALEILMPSVDSVDICHDCGLQAGNTHTYFSANW